MKLNEDTVLSVPHSPIVLVPYKAVHVKQYHEWMQSPVLQELTASEPLTLEEEYENMTSWRTDEEKLTFIILDSSISPNFMTGDVNIYFLHEEDSKRVAEVEVMIAEERSRRKGLATLALRMIMAYVMEHLKIDSFVAKILEGNLPSIALFTKTLKFKEERRVKAFGEVHYRLEVDEEVTKDLETVRKSWNVSSFMERIREASAMDDVK